MESRLLRYTSLCVSIFLPSSPVTCSRRVRISRKDPHNASSTYASKGGDAARVLHARRLLCVRSVPPRSA